MMVREPDATMQPAPQDNQLMAKHRVLSCKPCLRLEWRGQDDQNETKQPNHSASLGDSITSSTRMRFSVHKGTPCGLPACQRVHEPRQRACLAFACLVCRALRCGDLGAILARILFRVACLVLRLWRCF